MSFSQRIAQALSCERDALSALLEGGTDQYEDICRLFLDCRGKIVFMGVGKSGHIGKKLAATFSSMGIPSFFVHATEGVHGDLGMIEPHDIVVLISNSGNTSEVVNVIGPLRAIGCKTVAFTSGKSSKLAEGCDCAIFYPAFSEADDLNLAPTCSSTATLALGDAIACAVSSAKGFSPEDFHKYHPGGSLGQRLTKGKQA